MKTCHILHILDLIELQDSSFIRYLLQLLLLHCYRTINNVFLSIKHLCLLFQMAQSNSTIFLVDLGLLMAHPIFSSIDLLLTTYAFPCFTPDFSHPPAAVGALNKLSRASTVESLNH